MKRTLIKKKKKERENTSIDMIVLSAVFFGEGRGRCSGVDEGSDVDRFCLLCVRLCLCLEVQLSWIVFSHSGIRQPFRARMKKKKSKKKKDGWTKNREKSGAVGVATTP